MRPLRGRRLAAPCALLLLLGGLLHASPAGAVGRDYYGVNAQQVFKLPQSDWDAQLEAIARTGVGVVRRDAFWSSVEPTAPVGGVHRYAWTKPDAVIAALARHDLRWYPILDYATPWSGTLGWKSAPADPDDFAAYAAAFARRYGTGGSFWGQHPELPPLPVTSYEVWNEPNLDDFWPDAVGAADRYADLLAVTAPALRAADPSGRVVVGGLSPTDLVTFLDEVEARRPGLIASADAVAFHPYGTTWTNTGARIALLRDWLDAHGAARLPIEVTETGWATPPLPEETRAARMATAVEGLPTSSCDVTRFIAHTWLTPDVDPADPNDYFGIADADASLKPTGVAFADALAAVEAGTAPVPSDPCAGRVAPPSDPTPADPAPSDPAPPAPAPVVPTPAGAVAPPSPDVARTPMPPLTGAGAIASAHAGPAGARSLGVAVRARRRGPRTVVLTIACRRRCHARVRVLRPRAARLRARTSRRSSRRQRAIVVLPDGFAGPLRVEIRAYVAGAAVQRVVRTLR